MGQNARHASLHLHVSIRPVKEAFLYAIQKEVDTLPIEITCNRYPDSDHRHDNSRNPPQIALYPSRKKAIPFGRMQTSVCCTHDSEPQRNFQTRVASK